MKKLEKELQETEAVESQQKRAKLVSVFFYFTLVQNKCLPLNGEWFSTCNHPYQILKFKRSEIYYLSLNM